MSEWTGRVGETGRRGARTRHLALWLFFGSVAVNALLGIIGLAGAGLGGVEGKLLGTSLSVTGALVLALLCLPARERRLLRPVPVAAAALGAVGFALVAAGVWASGVGDELGRVTGTLLTVATSGTLASLAALARLPERARMVIRSAYVLLAISAVLIVVWVWIDVDGGWYARATGVALVLLAAVLVSLPVLHRLGRDAPNVASSGPPVGFCPFCASPVQATASGQATCGVCRRTFTVTSG